MTDEQRMLVDASKRFIEREWPTERVRHRSLVGQEAAADRRAAADLGWFSLLVPPGLGGGSLSDEPLVDCVLVARARGAGLHPGNFVGTNVVAAALVGAGPASLTESVLPQLISGGAAATWAAGGTGSQTAPTAGVIAQRVGADGYILRGTKCAVPGASDSDWILVSALTDDGRATQFLLPAGTAGVRVVGLESLDITRGFADLVLDDVMVPESALLGGWGEAADLVERQFLIAAVLTMAEMVGAMDADFALALAYAKTRTAFGRPIGSFQAVKHLLADTSLLLEMSDAMLFAAARSFGPGESEGAKVVSMAKAFISEGGVELVHNCFQVFGGIGFTWEHDQHLYLRRVTADAVRYGDAAWHRERFCQLAGL